MANKEVRIDYDKIRDSQDITRVNAEEFKKVGLDIHKNGVEGLIDDDRTKQRILKIKKPTKYFFQGSRNR